MENFFDFIRELNKFDRNKNQLLSLTTLTEEKNVLILRRESPPHELNKNP